MQVIIDYLSRPWPWYVAGPLIGLVIILLQWVDNKPFALSSSYRLIWPSVFPAVIPFLKYNLKKEYWNLLFAAGIIAGGFLAGNFLSDPAGIEISNETKSYLHSMGVNDLAGFAPAELFSFSALPTFRGLIIIVAGGFLVGFGSRYAGGCVSGHAMTGISDLQWTSMLATSCIFTGWIFTSYFLLPHILKL